MKEISNPYTEVILVMLLLKQSGAAQSHWRPETSLGVWEFYLAHTKSILLHCSRAITLTQMGSIDLVGHIILTWKLKGLLNIYKLLTLALFKDSGSVLFGGAIDWEKKSGDWKWELHFHPPKWSSSVLSLSSPKMKEFQSSKVICFFNSVVNLSWSRRIIVLSHKIE